MISGHCDDFCLAKALPEIAVTEIPIVIVGESGAGKAIPAAESTDPRRSSRSRFLKVSYSSRTPGRAVNGGTRLCQVGTVVLDEVSDLNLEQRGGLGESPSR